MKSSNLYTGWAKIMKWLLAQWGLKDSQVEIRKFSIRVGMVKIFKKIISLLVFTGFKDTQCGFKCFKRDAII